MSKESKTMICCCCGERTMGRQWWNRDKGFSLCTKCIPYHEKDYDTDEMKQCFGVRGYHYDIEGDAQ